MRMTASADQIIASPDFMSSHAELHHYTDFRGLEGIVRTNTLWATHFRDLNDSEEVTHLKEPLKTALSEILSRRDLSPTQRDALDRVGGFSRIAGDLVENLYRMTFEAFGYSSVEPFIVSFCTHADDRVYEREHGLLSQWRGYGGDGGYCLVFDTVVLCHMLAHELDRFFSVDGFIDVVQYLIPGIELNRRFRHFIESFDIHLSWFLDGQLGPEPEGPEARFLPCAPLLKHQGFWEEREARIVVIPGTEVFRDAVKAEHPGIDHPPPREIRYRQDGRRYLSLFEGLGERLPLKRVIVGPSNRQVKNMHMARDLLGSDTRVTCSETPFIVSIKNEASC
jgi:hypothetical protein